MDALKYIGEKRLGVFMSTFEKMIDQKIDEAKKRTFRQRCCGMLKSLVIGLIIFSVAIPFLFGLY